jgi:hypothetical protein
MMLSFASFTDAISLPPPTSLIACSGCAPASRSKIARGKIVSIDLLADAERLSRLDLTILDG